MMRMMKMRLTIPRMTMMRKIMMRITVTRLTMMRMIMRTWWWSVVPHCELIRHRPAELDSATETNIAAHCTLHTSTSVNTAR